MDINRKDDYYLRIAESLNGIIPIQWKKIILSCEVEEGAVTLFFYYYDLNRKAYFPEGDLLEGQGVGPRDFHQFLIELSKIVTNLHGDMKRELNDDWSTMTYVLDSSGGFHVDYGYENLDNSSKMDRRSIWELKYLN